MVMVRHPCALVWRHQQLQRASVAFTFFPPVRYRPSNSKSLVALIRRVVRWVIVHGNGSPSMRPRKAVLTPYRLYTAALL